MIGVICDRKQEHVIEEFFQLFKTPWRFARPGESYPVVVSTSRYPSVVESVVTVVYAACETSLDKQLSLAGEIISEPSLVCWGEQRFPVYGGLLLLDGAGEYIARHAGTGRAVGTKIMEGGRTIFRIGIDLPREVEHLLDVGQPQEWARYPTMEIHIGMLRAQVLSAGVPLAEIPPSPPGSRFVTCLTHDVDFAGVRFHRIDRTIVGFLSRATFGSLSRLARGDIRLHEMFANFAAVMSLPFVYLGAAPDFFDNFLQYARLEGTARSTFYLIPFKNKHGRDAAGKIAKGRACRYDLDDIRHQVRALSRRGCEIGLHGLDGWRDVLHATAERRRITEATGFEPTGVRMHWLWKDKYSTARLEDAGFDYDSTCGYNECVGFRAGTTQVFRPLGVHRLLELPLHIMDTALFYRSYLALTAVRAKTVIDEMFAEARHTGGVLTVNWHDRSLGPERFWGNIYSHILDLSSCADCWRATAAEVVRWFRKRRSALFIECDVRARRFRIKIDRDDGVPDLLLRIHIPDAIGTTTSTDVALSVLSQ